MLDTLATKYRPQTFEDVCEQRSVVDILKRQIEVSAIRNAYLFAGSSGCGKTTLARIFAKQLNKGLGSPIEIDAASNNGVDNVREIIQEAQARSINSEYKVYILDECVTGDTEILTDSGWQRFDSLSKTSRVAQYNDDGTIQFVIPYEYIERDYDGKMYNVKIGNKAVFCMSPNHVQPLYYTKSKKITESYIKDIKFAQSNKFIRSGIGCGNLTELSITDRLAIALQADGCLQHQTDTYNYWTIQLKKTEKINRLKELLRLSGFRYSELKSNRDGIERFSVTTDTKITKKFNTYFDLSSMSGNYAKDFIQELMHWDGYINKKFPKYLYYSSIDKDNVDFCQSVATIGGFKSRITHSIDNRKSTYHTIYALHLQFDCYSSTNTTVSKEEIDFHGKIYCVKVPSHKIIIRRNGFEIVTGNCHMLSNAAWNAFLKCIEEPPKYTIFIFCTTDPQKIPVTIQNRAMRFNISKISIPTIKSRLEYICNNEGFTNYTDCIDYIAKICDGSMRTAISYLEKVASYDTNLSMQAATFALGDYSDRTLLSALWYMTKHDESHMLSLIDDIYNKGIDLKQFVSQYMSFVLDVTKYYIFRTLNVTKIPVTNEDTLKTHFMFEGCDVMYNYYLDTLLELNYQIKYDTNPKCAIEVTFLQMTRHTFEQVNK